MKGHTMLDQALTAVYAVFTVVVYYVILTQ